MLNFLNPGEEVEDESLVLPPFNCRKNTSRETHTEKRWSRDYKVNLREFNEVTCGNNIRDVYYQRRRLRQMQKGPDQLPEYTHWNEDLHFDSRNLRKMRMMGRR